MDSSPLNYMHKWLWINTENWQGPAISKGLRLLFTEEIRFYLYIWKKNLGLIFISLGIYSVYVSLLLDLNLSSPQHLTGRMLNSFVPQKLCQCWRLLPQLWAHSIRGCIVSAKCPSYPQGYKIYTFLTRLFVCGLCVFYLQVCACVDEEGMLSISWHRLSCLTTALWVWWWCMHVRDSAVFVCALLKLLCA